MDIFILYKNRRVSYLYEDLNSHLLTLTQLAEESTALTVCPFGQKVRRGGDYLSHSLTIAISFVMTYDGVKCLARHCSVLRDTRTRGTT